MITSITIPESDLERSELVAEQNRRQKVVSRGACRSCRGSWHSNLTKIPLIYSVSYFNLGDKPTKAPLATGLCRSPKFWKGRSWGNGDRPSRLKSVPPIWCLAGPPVVAYIQYCISKMCPLCGFRPPCCEILATGLSWGRTFHFRICNPVGYGVWSLLIVACCFPVSLLPALTSFFCACLRSSRRCWCLQQ